MAGATGDATLRKRGAGSATNSPEKNSKSPIAKLDKDIPEDKTVLSAAAASLDANAGFKIAFWVLCALALVTRLWGIHDPAKVVFDEVHFGKVCLSIIVCCARA